MKKEEIARVVAVALLERRGASDEILRHTAHGIWPSEELHQFALLCAAGLIAEDPQVPSGIPIELSSITQEEILGTLSLIQPLKVSD